MSSLARQGPPPTTALPGQASVEGAAVEVKHFDVTLTLTYQVSGTAPIGGVIDEISVPLNALPGRDIQNYQASTYATVSQPRIISVSAEEQ